MQLDTLLAPLATRAASSATPEAPRALEPLPGLSELCAALRSVPGIDSVSLGRQAKEQRVVSQDLEVWITNQPAEGGFTLVARAGRLVQEVNLQTSLPVDAVKAAVLQVTSGLP